MKVLIYSSFFAAITSTVYADTVDANNIIMKNRLSLMGILAGLDNEVSNESFNVDNPLGHAEVKPGVGDASSILVGGDSGSVSEENILGDASPANPVLGEFGKQESLEDQNFGALSGTGPNEDEATRYKAELDSRLAKVSPAKVLDKANPNSPAAAA